MTEKSENASMRSVPLCDFLTAAQAGEEKGKAGMIPLSAEHRRRQSGDADSAER
jgi:hypothetical protein